MYFYVAVLNVKFSGFVAIALVKASAVSHVLETSVVSFVALS